MTWKVFQQELNLTHKTLKLQNSHDAMTQTFLSLRRVRGEQKLFTRAGPGTGTAGKHNNQTANRQIKTTRLTGTVTQAWLFSHTNKAVVVK